MFVASWEAVIWTYVTGFWITKPSIDSWLHQGSNARENDNLFAVKQRIHECKRVKKIMIWMQTELLIVSGVSLPRNSRPIVLFMTNSWMNRPKLFFCRLFLFLWANYWLVEKDNHVSSIINSIDLATLYLRKCVERSNGERPLFGS